MLLLTLKKMVIHIYPVTKKNGDILSINSYKICRLFWTKFLKETNVLQT